MKKPITMLLFAGMTVFSVQVFGQTSKGEKVVSSKQLIMAENAGVKATCQQITLAGSPAICLGFQNTGNTVSTFTWTLKDEKGAVVYAGKSMTLSAGQTLNVDADPVLKNRLTFILHKGATAEMYKVEINSKN